MGKKRETKEPFCIAKNKPEGICPAYGCRNPIGKKRRFCYKHHHRYQKYSNPLSYAYQLLKCNAKRRRKPFTLTMEEFKEFCEETNYLVLSGRSKNGLSIDRIDNTRGYEKGNIRAITLSENAQKGASVDYPF